MLAKARNMAQQIDAYRRLKKQLENYCRIVVLEFDEAAATIFQRLAKARSKVGVMDLKIAAIVLAHDATLLTRNSADFRRVPNLKFEDWTI
jgi:tRNA(fMet)-specific endonuclease VapC